MFIATTLAERRSKENDASSYVYDRDGKAQQIFWGKLHFLESLQWVLTLFSVYIVRLTKQEVDIYNESYSLWAILIGLLLCNLFFYTSVYWTHGKCNSALQLCLPGLNIAILTLFILLFAVFRGGNPYAYVVEQAIFLHVCYTLILTVFCLQNMIIFRPCLSMLGALFVFGVLAIFVFSFHIHFSFMDSHEFWKLDIHENSASSGASGASGAGGMTSTSTSNSIIIIYNYTNGTHDESSNINNINSNSPLATTPTLTDTTFMPFNIAPTVYIANILILSFAILFSILSAKSKHNQACTLVTSQYHIAAWKVVFFTYFLLIAIWKIFIWFCELILLLLKGECIPCRCCCVV